MNLKIGIVGRPNAVPEPSLLQSGGFQPCIPEERWYGMARVVVFYLDRRHL